MKSLVGTMYSGVWPFCPVEAMPDVHLRQDNLPKKLCSLKLDSGLRNEPKKELWNDKVILIAVAYVFMAITQGKLLNNPTPSTAYACWRREGRDLEK